MPSALLASPFVLAQAAPGSNLTMFLPMVLIFIVFYFFIIRPQKRREGTRKALIEALKKGDRVVTIGGIHGTVLKVEDASVLVEVDTNTKLRIDKNAVASVAAKETPASKAVEVS